MLFNNMKRLTLKDEEFFNKRKTIKIFRVQTRKYSVEGTQTEKGFSDTT